MQTAILNMARPVMMDHMPETILSFRPFIDYLKKRRQETSSIKGRFFSFVIEQYEQHPELLQPIEIEKVADYSALLQLIYTTLSPIIENEESQQWALSMPLKPIIFYGTNAYYNLVTNVKSGALRKSIASKDVAEIRKNQLEFTYSMVLEKAYNIPSFFNREVIHTLESEESGLEQYYKLTLDMRFIDIKPLRPLPPLDINALKAGHSDRSELIPILEELLPLDMFRFEGFGIANLTDVTSQYALEKIRNVILRHSSVNEERYHGNVIESLKALLGTKDIEFGLLPLIKVNDKLVFNNNLCLNSKLVRASQEMGVAEQVYFSMAEEYFKNPKTVFYPQITKEGEQKHTYLKVLKSHGVEGYALLPVFFNDTVAGVLEVYSTKKDMLSEDILARLDPVIPLLSQLLKNSTDEFDGRIDRVIKEKFTSIQPSVQWKFNEVAWHSIRDAAEPNVNAEIEDIEFEHVYPLYGAIDIRNSTIERNAALYQDLQVQFRILIEVLQQLKARSGFGLIDEKIFQVQKWLERISRSTGFTREVELNDFLENDITPFLLQFTESHQEYVSIVGEYFKAIDENDGVANESRRQLERSMNIVISAVNTYLETMKEEIQKAYPSYFEKFRTDGVEYDIYIGQSIAPSKPFNDIYLKNLRLLQVRSMASIARFSQSLREQMQRKIETTQLIFIHSHPINIRFRKDEKRFDVEGAYNIRYHIVKKRIDKVHVRDSSERLTQPGKIAFVYFNQREADEYISYIRFLQDEKVLENDLEYLDLEELQGVFGLKALRVGVVL
ncbi:MAG TPA: hypothetical protein VK644_08630 [Chitinophagaceae bacterium]|nr:hypothetical protein [Chitinophagaceae bacterium]